MGKFSGIKQNITQVVLIVFSVVLGLYLSERIEERKNKQASDNLLEKIKLEVRDNIKLMKDWSVYHSEIYEKLDSLSTDDEFIEEFKKDKSILFEKIFTRGNFMGRFPSNDAWDIAKSHPLIVNFDYDKLLILSKLYNQQKRTFEPGFEMFEILSSNDVNTEKNVKSNLKSMVESMFELSARERQLLDYYEEAEETLDLFIKLSPTELKKFSGNYWNDEKSYHRKIYVKDDTLRYYRNENSEYLLMPVSLSEFRMIKVSPDIFIRFDNDDTRSMTVIVAGDDPVVFNEFQMKVYTSEELENFEGRYYSKELDEYYVLKQEQNSLMLYINDSKKFPLKSVMNNLFTNDDYGTIKFTNDTANNNLTFSLKNGKGENIKFEKNKILE